MQGKWEPPTACSSDIAHYGSLYMAAPLSSHNLACPPAQQDGRNSRKHVGAGSADYFLGAMAVDIIQLLVTMPASMAWEISCHCEEVRCPTKAVTRCG